MTQKKRKPAKKAEKEIVDYLQNFTPKKRAMIEALEKSLGVVTTASKKTGITRQSHYDWMREDKEYNIAVKELKGLALDFGESALIRRMKEGSDTAIIFFLKTQAKDRGYVEKSAVDVTTNGENVNAPVMITMGDAKKKLEELENDI